MGAGAGGELPARGLAAAQCAPHFDEVEAEHVVQQEARAFERRQPFEEQHQRDRNILRKLAVPLAEGFVHHRLRQPRPDIDLAPRLRRFHPVKAEPRHHRSEIVARLNDRGPVGPVPAQIGILQHVLGLGARAQHAVGQPHQ
jgi:hypothetical protein